MKVRKVIGFGLFILFCLAVNLCGRTLAARYSLPLWLDCFGTVLCAYLAGPVCGSLVGFTSNCLYALIYMVSPVYALTSVALAVVTGRAARKKALQSVFGTMGLSFQVTLAVLIISLPLNLIFYGGSTGNVWGDGVIEFLHELGWPLLLSQGLGQFYVDFLDKLLTLLLVSLLLHMFPALSRWQEEWMELEGAAGKKESGQALQLLLFALLGASVLAGASARVCAASSVMNYNDYVQTVYSSKNGLPCGEANDITQTNDGVLWVGTYAGLYRYNGKEFRWMDEFDSVRNVNCLFVDSEGRLWIGTNDNGLSICIDEKIVNVVDESWGLPSNSVRAIIQSSDGYYYIGTTSSMQILTLNSGLKRVTSIREVNYADDVTADDQGHVAATTSDGRLFLLAQGQVVSSRQIPGGQEAFRVCHFLPDGRLLAGTTSNHIYVFDISDGRFQETEQISCPGLLSLKDMYSMENGDLFVTADNGVGFLDRAKEFHLVNTNDFNNSIDVMLADYQGNLWFTSSRLGLLRMAPSSFRDVYSTIGMEQRVVNAITKWKDAYYFGTDKGLDIVDADFTRQITDNLSKELEGVRIRCMLVDSSDHLWICTYSMGLLEVEPDGARYWYNQENGSFGNRSRLVTELSDGTILAGGDTGVSFIRNQEVVQTIDRSDGLLNSLILTATELPDGRILAGTDGDGIAILENREVTRILTRADGLTSEVILRTVLDEKGGGVFVVTSNGLCYMEADGTIRALDNFPYYNNYDIWIRDGETLYVMSSAGIYVVDRKELLSGTEDLSYDLLDSRRGLNSSLTANSWNYLNENGELFLPCDNGVYIADTSKNSNLTRAYRMMISQVKLDGVPLQNEQGNRLVINRRFNKMELSPEIINYTIQDPYVGYFLEGFEKEWTIVPQSALTSIIYASLPPENYTLHLAVFDNNQQEIMAERVYQIIVEEEIYDNPFFMGYLLIVPMIAVAWFTWFLGRMRMQRTLEIQKQELARQEQEIALQEQEIALQEQELKLARQEVQMGNETIIAIAKAVDAKDERTSQHSQRVSQYSVMIARKLGLSDSDCEALRKTALMHDIGKIGIPDAILNKPARLTDEEYSVMKSHTIRGAEILKDFTLIDHVVEGALHHHERYDGKGYPNHMKGEEIPLFARIIGVADAFDAMTANRVYRKQMDFGYVLEEMRKGRGTQFDPQFVDILLSLIEEGEINLNELYHVPASESETGGSV